jgi:hypothetical protein
MHYEFIGKEIEISEQMQIDCRNLRDANFGMRKYLITLFDKIIIYPSSYYSTVNEAHHKGEFNPRMKVIAFSWEDFY